MRITDNALVTGDFFKDQIVMVMRDTDDGDWGRGIQWNAREMDPLVGKIGRVVKVEEAVGVKLQIPGTEHAFTFPAFVLEAISEGRAPTIRLEELNVQNTD